MLIKIRKKKSERKKQNKSKRWLIELKTEINQKLNVQKTLMSKVLSGILWTSSFKIKMRMGSGGEEQGLQSLRVRIIQVRMIMIMRSWVIIKLMDTIVRMLAKLLIASMLFSKNQGGVIFQLCGQHLSLVTNSYMHLKSQNLLKGILNLLLRKRKFCIRLHKIIKIQIGLSF